MTIPSLMTKIKTARYRTAFKKGLATLNQAVKMNYANYGWDFASLDNSKSTCYNLRQGKEQSPESIQTICALMNGNLTGKTFLGNYDYDKNTHKYSVQNLFSGIPGSSPAYYVLYQLSDGTIIGLDRDQGFWSEERSLCTKRTSVGACGGFIDVNGKEGDNRVIKCANADDTKTIYDSAYAECSLEKDIGDVIPIVFYDQTVIPLTNAGRALFNSK
jgi:hypothetical protein